MNLMGLLPVNSGAALCGWRHLGSDLEVGFSHTERVSSGCCVYNACYKMSESSGVFISPREVGEGSLGSTI